MDAEGEASDDVVDEVDRRRLGVLLVHPQRSDPRGAIDRRLLEAPHLPPSLVSEVEELDVDLRHKLTVWREFYNVHRPHAGPKGLTPYEALREKLLS